MMSSSRGADRSRLLTLVLLLGWQAVSAAAPGGHVKGRLLLDTIPDDSVFAPVAGSESAGGELDVRFNFGGDLGRWSFEADYQAFALVGDRVELAAGAGLPQGPATIGVLNDGRRWFDLTKVLQSGSDRQQVHRLDRLYVGYRSGPLVLKAGRQALSWGNGLFFSPMDIVNPFDPAAIDTEYKTGDDMLYGQWLFEDGSDLQGAYVVRRDPVSGDVAGGEATAAIKYHRIAGATELDVLLADNRDRLTFGVGGSRALGGALLRADVIVAEEDDWRVESVVNLSYSWLYRGRNVTGAIEYYFNGWGLGGDGYALSDLAANPRLAQRIARGETFTIGRQYAAAGLTVELTPLWQLSPSLFSNLADPSALLQIVSRHSLSDNLTAIAALNVPIGGNGSEFGGIEAGGDRYLSRDAGLFLQLGFYF